MIISDRNCIAACIELSPSCQVSRLTVDSWPVSNVAMMKMRFCDGRVRTDLANDTQIAKLIKAQL